MDRAGKTRWLQHMDDMYCSGFREFSRVAEK
jgi:hypothetical protein